MQNEESTRVHMWIEGALSKNKIEVEQLEDVIGKRFLGCKVVLLSHYVCQNSNEDNNDIYCYLAKVKFKKDQNPENIKSYLNKHFKGNLYTRCIGVDYSKHNNSVIIYCS